MVQPRKLVIVAGAAATAFAVLRHGRRGARGRQVPGGILIGDAVLYDKLSRLLLNPLVQRIAADVAAVAPDGARILEAGCGPGHLSTRLARDHGFEVIGLDLDPAMIARAQANTDPAGNRGGRRASFLVGDVAALAFPDQSFDLVVSTLSMHHWADPAAGLAEIGRVLRSGAPSTHLGLPTRRPTPSIRTTPRTHPRPGRPHPWLSAPGDEHHTVALALAAPPHPTNRVGPRR